MSNVRDAFRKSAGDAAGINAVSSFRPVTELLFEPISLHLSDGSPVFPFDPSHQLASEQYRMIRTKILQMPKRPRTLVVSSAGRGDGKTTTSLNIAGVLALKKGERVILVEADLRRPSLAPLLGLAPHLGLAEFLEEKCSLMEAVVQVEQIPGLYLLLAGSARLNPAELLDSDAWRRLCQTLRDQFTFTVLDAPPVAGVADYELLQVAADGIILVARPDHTSRPMLRAAYAAVNREKLIGIVLNCVEDWLFWKIPQYGYYGTAPLTPPLPHVP